jgi:hypothetical protein
VTLVTAGKLVCTPFGVAAFCMALEVLLVFLGGMMV